MMWIALLYDDGTEGGSTLIPSPTLERGRVLIEMVGMDAKKGTVIGVTMRDGDWKSDVPLPHEHFKYAGTFTLTELTMDIMPNTIPREEFINAEPKTSRLGHARKVITG